MMAPRKFVPGGSPWGLYVHLPFCAAKCPYCQFVSITGGEALIGRYVDALHRELDLRGMPGTGTHPRTIYLGGGTPSLVPAPLIAALLDRIAGPGTIEITVEANPESLSGGWLASVRDAGVTRLSIGIQSLDDTVLATLGRVHSADRALRALELAGSAGFENISADIMFGVPGQSLASLRDTLDVLAAPPVSHLSCYGLSIEEDTTYWRRVAARLMTPPDPGLSADMYGMVDELLAGRGFERYEISNFARPGHSCRHNEAYWDLTPYLGIGVSAHSFDGVRRFWGIGDVEGYLTTVEGGGDPMAGAEEIRGKDRAIETAMLALRTARGYDTSMLDSLPPLIARQSLQKLDDVRRAGFVTEREPGIVVLTRRGVLIADEIIAELAAIIG